MPGFPHDHLTRIVNVHWEGDEPVTPVYFEWLNVSAPGAWREVTPKYVVDLALAGGPPTVPVEDALYAIDVHIPFIIYEEDGVTIDYERTLGVARFHGQNLGNAPRRVQLQPYVSPAKDHDFGDGIHSVVFELQHRNRASTTLPGDPGLHTNFGGIEFYVTTSIGVAGYSRP